MGRVTKTVSGAKVSFKSPGKVPVRSLKAYFSPVLEGSGDQSSSNIRPITGLTGCKLWHTGKNKAHVIAYGAQNSNSATTAQRIKNSYGTTISTTTYASPDTPLVITQSEWPRSDVLTSFSNGYFGVVVDNLVFYHRYDVSFKVSDVVADPLNAGIENMRLQVPSGSSYVAKRSGDYLIYKNVEWSPYANNRSRSNFEIRICGISFTLSEFMVTEVGETDRTFEPYRGTLFPIDWSSQGTVYGGYVDLISGELIAEWEMASARWGDIRANSPHTTTGLDQGTLSFRNRILVAHQSGDAGSIIVCNSISRVMWNDASRLPEHYYAGNANNKGIAYLYLPDDFDDENTVQLCAKLETPIVYQLTAKELKTLRGQNNIWSDTETVEVEYDYAESNDMLSVRKRIIAGNAPHIVPASGSVVKFDTDVAAKLKDCQIRFFPIQEGTGDPSPTNIRQINGWTVFDVYCIKDALPVTIVPGTSVSYGVTFTVDGDGKITADGIPTSWSTVYFGECAVNGDETIYGSFSGDMTNRAHVAPRLYDEDGNRISASLGDGALSSGLDLSQYPGVKKVEVGIKRMTNGVSMHGSCYYSLTKGARAQITTLPVSWQSSPGVVYGGHVDQITGVLSSEYVYCEAMWGEGTKNRIMEVVERRRFKIPDGAKAAKNLKTVNSRICNVASWLWNYDQDVLHWYADNGYAYVFLPIGTDDSLNVQMLLELEEPVVYQLDPATIRAYKGNNSIVSDANGDIELKYWKH